MRALKFHDNSVIRKPTTHNSANIVIIILIVAENKVGAVGEFDSLGAGLELQLL